MRPMTRSIEIVVASGKGGTGKTTVSAFLISFFSIRGLSVIGVDADVEAPDLVIALGGVEESYREHIYDSQVAVIDYDQCISCGECFSSCRFGAIDWNSGPVIINEMCEGCGLCSMLCPVKAISMKEVKTGSIVVGKTKYCDIITGELEIGRKHSGRLVEIVKGKAREAGAKYVFVDAAAGIGGPVISSIAGSDFLIVVVEPTRYSIDTASKVIKIGKTFGVEIGVIVNKFDINIDFLEYIKKWASEKNVEILGMIPFDDAVIRAYVNMQSLLDFAPDSKATESLREIAEKILVRFSE